MANIKTLKDLQKYMAGKQSYELASFEFSANKGKEMHRPAQLFGDYILENATVLFPAKRGTGKSLLCMQICLAICCSCKEFLGEPITKFGKCVYIDFEMSMRITQMRAATLREVAPNYTGDNGDNLIIYNTRRSFVEDFETINDLFQQEKPILIVIDNLRSALRGVNTNSGTEMASFFAILNTLKEIYGFAIVVIDHLRKNTNNLKTDSDLQSGSGVKTDLSDGDFMLRNSCQNKKWRLLKRMKSRLTEESDVTKLIALNPKTLWFELVKESVIEAEHIGLAEIQDKEELKDIAVDMYEKGSTLEEIARATHKSKSTIHRYIAERKPNGNS
jgi:RecA-family ATPase